MIIKTVSVEDGTAVYIDYENIDYVFIDAEMRVIAMRDNKEEFQHILLFEAKTFDEAQKFAETLYLSKSHEFAFIFDCGNWRFYYDKLKDLEDKLRKAIEKAELIA